MTAGADREASLAGTDRDENAFALARKMRRPVNETGEVMTSVEKGGNQHGDEI